MLKLLISKKEYDELPDAVKEHYKAEGEDFVLDSDDSSMKSKISDFRNNNIELRKKIEQATAELTRYKDIDPEKYQEAVEKLQELEEKQLLDNNQVEDLINLRTDRMRATYDGKINALETSLNAEKEGKSVVESKLASELLGGRVSRVVTKLGKVKVGALPYIESAAAQVFKLQDGELVPMKGKDVLYGKDGKDPLTMEEFVTDLQETSPFLFEGSSGSNASGNNGSGQGSSSVDRTDAAAFSSNLEKIAKGEVKAV